MFKTLFETTYISPMLNHDNMSKVTIKTCRFKLFEKEVFLVLRDDQVESLYTFFELLNKRVNIEEAKKAFVDDYIKRTSYGWNRLVNIPLDYNLIIKNFLGAEETMNKMEEFYRVSLRDSKIDEITNE